MRILNEPFEIAYCGVSLKVIPVINGSDMQYIVKLPTRELTIETVFDENEIDFWQEIPAGRSEIAEEIGLLIEGRDM